MKARGLTNCGLKKDLKERLEKYMVDKVFVASYISEVAATPLVLTEYTYSIRITIIRTNSEHRISCANSRS